MSTVIKVENLCKRYFLSHKDQERFPTLRDAITHTASNIGKRLLHPLRSSSGQPLEGLDSTEEFWALDDVSFEITQGDRVGIIGRNGAGKSTLLKIMSRITEPTKGRVSIKGRVASLLEVGTGFHPELTGRENIYLNGAILGMSKHDIRRKFDEIVVFSEIEKFLDTPVKRYSSGMYVRLAFSVAAHLEPEILIVDEVLAVGDAQFQKKCLGKMEEAGRDGRTVLFVSHNIGAVHSLTQKCVNLDRGKVSFFGETHDAVSRYLAQSMNGENEKKHDLDYYRREYVEKTHQDNIVARYSDVWVERQGKKISALEMGEGFDFYFEIEVTSEIYGANLSLSLLNSESQFVTVIFSWDKGYYLNLLPGKHVIKLEVRDIVLAPGQYFIISGINQTDVTTPWDAIFHFPVFEIKNSGKIFHWLHRPWGAVHCDNVQWFSES